MKNDTPITKAQVAAQDLLNRTQHATKQFLDSISDSTDRFSSELTSGAREAVDTMQDAGDRVRTELTTKAEPTAEQVSNAVTELIAWARRNSERLITDLDEFRSGLEARLAPVTVVTKADLAELEARVAETEAKLAKAMKATAKAKAPAKKATSKAKAPAKKAASPKS
jgi:chromosome condensin MukBEF complex kleisin-like MukF subunit